MSAEFSLRLEADFVVRCHVYADTTPILSLWNPDTGLTLTTAKRSEFTNDDVRLARALLAAVETYVTEVERLASPVQPVLPLPKAS